MLRSLKLVGVGPAPEMEMQFAPRLNVLTGDNGLGKSLFLETIWYVLTGNWAGIPVWPQLDAEEPRIEFQISGMGGPVPQVHFQREKQAWGEGGPFYYDTFLVVYARVDGSIAVWDPNRRHVVNSPLEPIVFFLRMKFFMAKEVEIAMFVGD